MEDFSSFVPLFPLLFQTSFDFKGGYSRFRGSGFLKKTHTRRFSRPAVSTFFPPRDGVGDELFVPLSLPFSLSLKRMGIFARDGWIGGRWESERCLEVLIGFSSKFDPRDFVISMVIFGKKIFRLTIRNSQLTLLP